ncbi:MAG: VWA domain-containing protein, partial [Planctomycetaceae bacterium]
MDEALAALPSELFSIVVTHSHGELQDRAPAVAALRSSWLRGEWPAVELKWPARVTMQALRDWVEQNELLRLCAGSQPMTDELLTDVLRSLEGHDRDAAKIGRRLLDQAAQAVENSTPKVEDNPLVEALSHVRSEEFLAWLNQLVLTDVDGTDERVSEPLNGLTAAQSQELAKILANAVQQWLDDVASQAARQCVARVDGKWAQRLSVWRQLEEVFGPLAARLDLGWDLSAGIFQSRGWQDLKKYQKLIDRLPQIKDLVRELGKLRMTDDIDDEVSFPDLFESLKRTREEQQEIEHPLAKHQAKGIERSGDFTRMLPSEAMLRLRPRLKLLWHAKRAENALLTYRVRGTYIDRVSRESEEEQPQSRRRERGPIIVCLDTSGSMSGGPEAVAKALVLEACRTAHAENRRCLLYSFSGSNDCAELELSLTPDGLASLLDFLAMSFGGGTDIDLPFRKALSRLQSEEWSRADILLVSDGDFGQPSSSLQAEIDDA